MSTMLLAPRHNFWIRALAVLWLIALATLLCHVAGRHPGGERDDCPLCLAAAAMAITVGLALPAVWPVLIGELLPYSRSTFSAIPSTIRGRGPPVQPAL